MRPIADIERDIREAIATVQADGWRLKPGVTISRRSKTCCPLGAVFLAHKLSWLGRDSKEFPDPVIKALGLKYQEALMLTNAFDAEPLTPKTKREKAMLQLGQALAAELVGDGGSRVQ